MKVELVSSVDQLFSSLFIFILGVFIINVLYKTFQIKFLRELVIYLYHTFFMFVYIFYSLKNGADSITYYIHSSLSEVISFGIGTEFIIFILDIFSFFNLSYLGYFLLFNIFGTLGLLYFYASILRIVKNKTLFYRRLSLIIVFLPSISFWSVAIGKDAIAFMSVGILLWASLNLKQRKFLMAFAVIAMFMVRPHIAMAMLLSLSFVFVFGKDIKILYKVLISSFLIVVSFFTISFVLKYIGLESIQDVNQATEYIEKRQSYNQGGGGGIDISNMNILEQTFTYMFRPLPFEAHSVSSLLASIDNLYLFFLFSLFIYSYIKKEHLKSINNDLTFLIIYSFILILILSMTTANLGIAVRQKWMFMPVVIFIWFTYICGPIKNKFIRKSL